MEKHRVTVHGEVEGATIEPPVEAEDVTQAEPVVPEVVSEAVTLKFRVPVQVTINGKHYPEVEGKVIEAPSIEIAAEIVRIIRESALGDVLER